MNTAPASPASPPGTCPGIRPGTCPDDSRAPGLRLSWLTALAAALASAVPMLLGACASPGPAHTPHALLSAQAAGATAAADGSATPWPAARWWTGFNDPQLDALVAQALVAQPSLQSAQARLRQAQAALDATNAGTLPQVSGAVDLTNERFSEHGLVPPQLGGRRLWNNNAQINASWELDLFGRQRAQLDSAIGQLRAAQAETQAANVLLAGNTAVAYFNLARLLETRSVAEAALDQRRQVLALVRQRVDAGLDTTVDLRQAEGLIAQSQVEIEALAENAARARHALAELTGQGPHALEALVPALAAVRSAPLPQSLPADLVGRRADLVAQRWRVEAALGDVGVARAQFYPNINLVAFLGLNSLGFDNFLKAGSLQYGAGPALRLPIFEGGRLRANLQARQAEVDAATDAYNAALLRALREVADEVSSLQSVERQQRAQLEATGAADAAFDLAVQRYRAGLGNFLTVLTAQTNVLAQRRAVTELKARHLVAEATLARALGGGFGSGAGADAAAELPPLRAAADSTPTAITSTAITRTAIPTTAIRTSATTTSATPTSNKSTP